MFASVRLWLKNSKHMHMCLTYGITEQSQARYLFTFRVTTCESASVPVCYIYCSLDVVAINQDRDVLSISSPPSSSYGSTAQIGPWPPLWGFVTIPFLQEGAGLAQAV
jgi:hypothetical protein